MARRKFQRVEEVEHRRGVKEVNVIIILSNWNCRSEAIAGNGKRYPFPYTYKHLTGEDGAGDKDISSQISTNVAIMWWLRCRLGLQGEREDVRL